VDPVRLAEPGEAARIEEIETASDRLLEPLGLWPLPQSTAAAKAAESRRTVVTLVHGRPALGFVRIELVDGHPHIGQVSVLPEHAGTGIGAALMRAAFGWAEASGFGMVTLTTFVSPPFNAPWYAKLGFETVAPPYGPELADVVATEAGLEALDRRVVMVRRLGADAYDDRP
jgi:GNAT superfamily N-acetyltransferase